jgi:hypothetical protein
VHDFEHGNFSFVWNFGEIVAVLHLQRNWLFVEHNLFGDFYFELQTHANEKRVFNFDVDDDCFWEFFWFFVFD